MAGPCCAGAAAASSSSSSTGSLLGIIATLPIFGYQLAPRVTVVLTAFVVTVCLGLYLLVLVLSPISTPSTPSELHFVSSKDSEPQPLPSIKDQATVQLSVVVPAYNERERLPTMLTEAVDFLEGLRSKRQSLANLDQVKDKTSAEALESPLQTYEIVIVDDGSQDATDQVVLDLAEKTKLGPGAEIRLIKLEKNRGKGGAVRHGVLHSRGSIILFADADSATKFSELTKLCKEMARSMTKNEHGIVVGSRAHLVNSEVVVKRSFIRNLLMHCFHLFLSILMRPPSFPIPSFLPKPTTTLLSCEKLPTQQPIQDTQCGFKLFTRNTASTIFPACHINRWIFDVEILLLAEVVSKKSMYQHLNNNDEKGQEEEEVLGLTIPIKEVSVEWKEIGGSKIDLLTDSIRMALDLIVIRLNYTFGRWKIPNLV